MLASGGVTELIARLRSRSKVQQAAAARALGDLSRSANGCASIAMMGGTAALVEAVRNGGSAAVQQHALAALTGLAGSSAEEREAIAAMGVIPTLVQLLRQPGALAEEAVGVVCNLAAHDQTSERCMAIAAAGGIPALVTLLLLLLLLLLHSGTEGGRVNAARAICNMGRYEGSRACVAAGALPPLVALAARGSAEQQAIAMAAIGNLGMEAECSAAAVEAGVMPLLVTWLQSGSSEAQKGAAWVLQELMYQGAAARQAFLEQPGGLASLLSLLNHPTNHVRLSGSSWGSDCSSALPFAVAALLNLAQAGRHACEAMAAAGAVDSLAQLLQSCSETAAVENSVQALQKLSAFVPCRAALLSPGVLPVLKRVQDASESQDAAIAAAALQKLIASEPAGAAGSTAGLQTETSAARPARPPAPRVCAAPGCGATNGLKRCGGCGTVRYCSQACCKAHWPAHKAECRRLQVERAAVAAQG